MEATLKSEFEAARLAYLKATVLVDMLNDDRQCWYNAHNVTRETMRAWLGDASEMPSDLEAINAAATEAVLHRSECYRALIAAARRITAVVAKRHNYGAAELDQVFDHMESRPYSPTSAKALDAILRLDVST